MLILLIVLIFYLAANTRRGCDDPPSGVRNTVLTIHIRLIKLNLLSFEILSSTVTVLLRLLRNYLDLLGIYLDFIRNNLG